MQITGKLIQLLPAQSGEGKNGPWKKQDIIIETEGQYPKKVCITIWGDKADSRVLVPGNQLRIDFDLESREFNNRWYTDVKAWKIESAGPSASNEYSSGSTTTRYTANEPPPPVKNSFDTADLPPLPPMEESDDLPF